MSDELRLLDDLLGGAMPFLLAEQHLFASDRRRFLRSLRNMVLEKQVEVIVGDQPIEVWRIEAWARRPHAPESEADLRQARLEITPTGVKVFY
jgi:hypothetical protein